MNRTSETRKAMLRGAHEAREDAAALRGESRQARRHAADICSETNAILDAVAEMMTRALDERGFRLLVPVAARFRTPEGGSTGVEVVVRLADPSHADAAKAALGERFPDPLSDVIVGA